MSQGNIEDLILNESEENKEINASTYKSLKSLGRKGSNESLDKNSPTRITNLRIINHS